MTSVNMGQSNNEVDRQDSAGRRRYLKTVGLSGIAFGLAGCSAFSGSGGDKIKFGHIAPLQKDIGKGSLRGTQIAAKEINDNGGINGKQIELVHQDSHASSSQASTVINNFINSKKVNAISGGFTSESVLAILDRIGQSNVPYFDTGASSQQITRNVSKNMPDYKNIFRVSPVNAIHQAKSLAQYAQFLNKEHGWTKFAIGCEDADWTKLFNTQTATLMKQSGLDVVMNTRFAPDTTDFTPILNKAENSGAQVFMHAIGHISGTSMLQKWHQNKYPFAMEGCNISSMSPSYWGDTNGSALYDTTVYTPGGVAEVTDKTKHLIKKYRKKYSSRPVLPMYMGVGSYDAVYIYKNAVESAGTADPNKIDKIVSSLEKTDYTGASGHIQFTGPDAKYAHDVKYGEDLQPMIARQWQKATNGNGLAGTDGTKVAVWPKKYATGKHQAPSWL